MNEQAEELVSAPMQAPTVQSGGLRSRVGIWLRWVVPLVSVLAAWLLWHGHSEPAKETAGAARDVPFLDGKWIRYSAAFAQRAGLVFAAPEARSLSPVVHVTGTVGFDPGRVAAIGARIAGRVHDVHKLEGDTVAAGEMLAEIESAELGEAQATVISARAHYEAAAANETRERELSEARISSHREAEVAKAVAASARADLTAAEQRVKAMGGSTQGEAGVLRLTSPIAGKVVERHLSRGQFVEPTLTAFRVADLRRLWLQLAVYERDLAAIRVGDSVDILAPGAAEPLVRGKVGYVAEVIDVATRTAQVRVVIEQPPAPLRPGQSVLARIHTSAPALPRLVLPRDAVTSVDGKATVFVAGPDLTVEPRVVQLGSQDGTHVEVNSGLSADERVAVGGVFALKSEIFR
ncbi:MAG TPA: efflux RND transporter periplasmic adaptor subunit [Polyangiales bacterium]